MSTEIPVVVPHESVNDDTVKLIRWLVEDGQQVNPGEPVAEVEGSKSTFEVPCSQAGIVCRRESEGQEIPVGAALCYVRVAEETENLQPSSNGIASIPLSIPTAPQLPEQRPVHAQTPSTGLNNHQPEARVTTQSQRFSIEVHSRNYLS
jgi:pyruvate/2-oxoglutarate dehydrogenase complex dihydrolipoamide acyltransferase (E2) component